MQPIPFATQSYLDSSKPVSVQRLVNMYLEAKPTGAKSRTVLHGTPGLKLWSSVGSGPCRGLIGLGEFLYVVSGTELYRVDKNGAATFVNVVEGVGQCFLASNGTHVVIGTNSLPVYAVNATSFQELPIENVNGVAFQDGYILVTKRGTQELAISGLNDALSWSDLDFTLTNANPDLSAGIANLNRETWAFQERSAQVYYNSGAAAFPFELNPSGVVERGCIAEGSIATILGVVMWLGDDLRVYRNNGYVATPISTTAIDSEIATLSAPSSAVGFVYSQRGHFHYVLTFPSQRTFVYDLTTGLWHERESWQRNDWRARNHEYYFSRHLAGDAVNGNIYELDLSTYSDNGDPLRRVMTSPPIHQGRSRLFMSRLEIDAEFGVGLEGNAQGSDPEFMLRWSDDGGRTYSNELWRTLGKSGEYKHRAVWTRLGSFRERSYEISMSDPVDSVVIEAYGRIVAGGLS